MAMPTLEHLYELDPLDGRIAVQLASAYLETGQEERALELLEYCRKQPNMEQTHLIEPMRLSVLYQMGRKDKANELFNQTIQIQEGRRVLLMQWSQILQKDKRWQTLFDMLQDTSGKYPDLIPIIAERILQLYLQENQDIQSRALNLLADMEVRFPDQVPVLLALGRLYHASGNIEQAVKYYKETLSLNPDQPIAINNLSWILCTEMNECRQALQMANHGLEINPDHLDLLDTRGEIYYSLGIYEQAAEDLKKAVCLYEANSPEKTKSCYRLVRSLSKLGDKEQMQNYLQMALDLNKTSRALSSEEEQELDRLLKESASL